MRLHLAGCRFCRRYARHLRFLRESVHVYADRLDSISCESLSLDARRKIIDALKRAP